MFIGADIFIHSLHTFRACWIKGRYGGGKTLLSVALAQHFDKQWGYNIFSNVPIHLDNVIHEPKPPLCDGTRKICNEQCVDFPKNHSFIVYDEAWLSLGMDASPKAVRSFMAYLRKVDVILAMPSVMDLRRGAYMLWCERVINLGTIGIPLWIYEWGLPRKSAKKSGGRFAIWWPQAFYGTYDTHAQPDDLDNLFVGDLRK